MVIKLYPSVPDKKRENMYTISEDKLEIFRENLEKDTNLLIEFFSINNISPKRAVVIIMAILPSIIEINELDTEEKVEIVENMRKMILKENI